MTDPAPLVAQPNPTVQPSWIPSRKVIAGGFVGIITWALAAVAQHYLGVPVPPDLLTPLVIGAISLTSYAVPPSVKDVTRRLNDQLVLAAAADPKSAVSEHVVIAPPPKVQAP